MQCRKTVQFQLLPVDLAFRSGQPRAMKLCMCIEQHMVNPKMKSILDTSRDLYMTSHCLIFKVNRVQYYKFSIIACGKTKSISDIRPISLYFMSK